MIPIASLAKSGRTVFKRHKSTLPVFQDLSSYLSYAKNKGLGTGSTVFNGTSYELTAIEEIERCLGTADMRHVGGADDKGIDALGTWNISKLFPKSDTSKIPNELTIQDTVVKPILRQPSPRLNVLVQCKNYAKKITPKEIRELSGIYHNAFSRDEEKTNSIVLFCAPSLMTKKGVEQLNNSNFPIGYCQISRMIKFKEGDKYDPDNYRGGRLQAFYGNPVLLGLLHGTEFLDYINLVTTR